MRKKLLSVLAVCSMFIGAYAELRYMVVELNDGSLISFALADRPVITYENSNLLTISSEYFTVCSSYALEDVKNYHFAETYVAGSEETAANVLNVVRIDDQTIEVQNAVAGSPVTFTAMNGAVIYGTKVGDDGVAAVRIPDHAGVYVLSAGSQSFKIICKH